MKSKLSKVILCILVTVFLYSYICLIVTPKSISDFGGQTFYRGMGFLAEPKNTLDVMFFGNSDVYAGIAPALLYEKFGITSYASGVPLQNMKNINILLNMALKNQKPKVIVLEVDGLYEDCHSIVDTNNFFLAPFMYHTRWKDIKLRDFYTVPSRKNKVDITKGYMNSSYIYKHNPGDYMGNKNSRPIPIPRKSRRQLKAFLKTCKANNIKVIFLELPSSVSWNYGKHNYVKMIASKAKVPFIDLNIVTDKFIADFSKDFRDDGNHMNSIGAKKATNYLGYYLKRNYKNIYTNKRSNHTQIYWQDVVNKYYNNLN